MCTHRVFYHVQQWISLMYYDHNVYLQNQHCEYCGEMLRMFEKIIFPKKCKNNHSGGALSPENINALRKSQLRKSPLIQINNEELPFNVAADEEIAKARKNSDKIKKNGGRPHFYHVICYDLICDTIKKAQ